MERVNVIGTTGSGKSTFSKRLAAQMGCPYLQMDQIFWKANWQESADEEFFPKLEGALSAHTWVLDGNYSRTNAIKWARADTVVWLDYSYSRTFLQLLKRTVKRSLSNDELWAGTGNKETFSKSFLSRNSILIWFFRGYGKNKLRNVQLMNSPAAKHVRFIRLCSPKEADAFIQQI